MLSSHHMHMLCFNQQKEVIIGTELVTEGSEDVHPENNVITQNITVRRLARLELQGTGSPYKALFQVQVVFCL